MVVVLAHKRPKRGLVPRLRRALAALMDELGVGDKAVTVILTGDRRLRALKRAWWGEDEATDVLSFPHYEPGDPFVPPHLGDIWISLDTAQRQAEARGASLEEEVLVLAAHGLWHLLGHDHGREEGWEGFRQVQERILAL
ncbi:rRNA maturation RNase YbeY [Thermus sediminis]|uniref:rRNA maturation RNase YbeY n=1 Tax=Thermus sediminis TaxID=1761908 RepID=UPI000E3DE263|nr:rRNA maturation RNase YbeY [Thermus sediminis]